MKTDALELITDQLEIMAHKTLVNYAIPGLRSSLIGGPAHGTVRLFHCERNHVEPIIPHSHRFDFACLVLEGKVRNRLWGPWGVEGKAKYMKSALFYNGAPGDYELRDGIVDTYGYMDTIFGPGDIYMMTSDEIHSIYFSEGAKVLLFEGPSKAASTVILQPVLKNGMVVPTFKVEDWMFMREGE